MDLVASLDAAGGSNGDVIPGSYIVVLQDDVDASRVPEVAADIARQHTATVGFNYQHALKGFSARMSEQAATNMARNPNVKYVEPDRVVRIGPLRGKPGPPPPAESTPWGIRPGQRRRHLHGFERGFGATSGVIAGVDHVAANGSPGHVANMSLGGGLDTALDQAVVNASATGVRFVLAAGNDSDLADNHSPARANGSNIVTVCAFDVLGNWASFSNYGTQTVDYCAPGVGVLSTWKGGGHNTISGTSMAAPHVAGIWLLGSIQTAGAITRVQGEDYPAAFH